MLTNEQHKFMLLKCRWCWSPFRYPMYTSPHTQLKSNHSVIKAMERLHLSSLISFTGLLTASCFHQKILLEVLESYWVFDHCCIQHCSSYSTSPGDFTVVFAEFSSLGCVLTDYSQNANALAWSAFRL